MTQRQGVVFRYLARLMMVIPGGNVHTLRELMENGEPFRKYVEKLDATAQAFFRTQFFSPLFAQTKKQILARLWGVLSNPVFDRMFSHKRNTVDPFNALNSGKVVLVNTAKELLQKDGSQILGRFFIALIAQAALKRAILSKDERIPAFVYIDEAQEYFDDKIEDLLNQARKYRVGITLAHQNLDQLSTKLKATIMASTSVKLVGGMSAKDAAEFAREMRCTTERIEDTRKTRYSSTFVCSVRNVTHYPVKISVPLGAVEELPTMSEDEYESLLAVNRGRYCAPAIVPRQQEVHQEERPEREVMTELKEKERPEQETPAAFRTPEPPPAVIPPAEAKSDPKASTSVRVPTPAPERLAARPEIVVPRPKPLPAEVPLGRGGREHKYLQQLLKQLAESRGFRATIEEEVLEGSGRIDVSLLKRDTRIACEISITSSAEQELGNVRKCLEAGYTRVVLLSSEKKRLIALKKAVSKALPENEREKVLFYLPEEFISYLDTLEVPESAVQTVRGYTVKVKYHAMAEGEQKARRDAIAKVIVGSMKRMSEA